MLKAIHRIFLAAAILVAVLAQAAGPHGSVENPAEGYIYGKVVKITDGDTLTILTAAKAQVKIRLSEIDTPERSQPYGKKAQDELSELVWPKDIAVMVVDIDRYGRTVGRIYVGEIDVSAEMVRRGAAWVYRKYATDESLYGLEDDARQNKRGIWSLSEADQMPPWEWRSIRRN